MNIEHVVSEIKQKIDIVDYIGSLVTLKKAGKNYTGLCPFHSEKTPSFVISPDRQIWKCFGACQDGGDVISFNMKWENVTFFESIRDFAHKLGIQIDDTNIEDRAWKKKEKIMQLNSLAAKYYHYVLLNHESGKAALEYVKNRGLDTKLIDTFLLGYSPQSWDSLLSFLRKKGFSEDEIVHAGLATRNDNNRVYDRFRGRLMFPIMNARHEVLGFSGRLIHDDQKQAKYINTSETDVYKKRETLFGMQVAHESIRKNDAAILVEGEFDMISSFKNGIPHTVAIKGSAVTKDQLMLLKRYTKHIILALDADFSGASTTLRAIKDAESMDFRIDIITFDFGKDPDEALQNNPVAYKKLLKKPTPLYDFILNTAIARHNLQDPYEKKAIASEVLPFIHSIMNPIVKAHYIRRLSDLIETSERDISLTMREIEKSDIKKRVHTHATSQAKTTDRFESVQKYVLSYLLQSEEPMKVLTRMVDVLEADDFTVQSYHDIYEHFETFIETSGAKGTKSFNMKNFVDNFSPPLQAVLDELYLLDITTLDSDKDDEKNFQRTVLDLKQYSLRYKIKQYVQEKETKEGTRTIASLTKELARVEKARRVL